VADEPFAADEIRRLEELWLRARELAIDDALAGGQHGAVLGEIEYLVAEHPLRERLHAQRMLALYRSGRQAEALEAYVMRATCSWRRSASSRGPSSAACTRRSCGKTPESSRGESRTDGRGASRRVRRSRAGARRARRGSR
jgi:DNA-binding SARP family transcriptional activator